MLRHLLVIPVCLLPWLTSLSQHISPYKTPQARWGFKDADGKIVVEARYIYKPGPFHEGRAIVTDSTGRQGVISDRGKELVAPVYDAISPFQNGYALITLYQTSYTDGQTNRRQARGVINREGKVVVPADYKFIAGDFTNGWFVVADSANGQKVYFTKTGNRILPPPGYKMLAVNLGRGKFLAKKDGHFGIVDKRFRELFPPEYDGLFPGPGGLIIAVKKGKTGILTSKLKWLAEPIYKNIDDFSHNHAIVEFDNNSYGVMNHKGKITTRIEYTGLAMFGSSGRPVAVYQHAATSQAGLLDMATGSELTPPVYDFIETKSREDISVFWRNGRKGLIHSSGRELFYGEYDDFVNGFLFDRAWVKKNGKYGFIDREGTLAVPAEYDMVNGFNDGLARVKKGGRWGYINIFGNIIIPLQYEDAESFDGGIARVKNGQGQWFYIDLNGNEIK